MNKIILYIATSKDGFIADKNGDYAIGNMLPKDSKLSAIIDFGGVALGDPACDLVVAWTFLNEKACALWKATFELCQIADKNSPEALIQKRIIEDVIYE